MPYTATIQAVCQALSETISKLDAWFEQSGEIRAYKPSSAGLYARLYKQQFEAVH
jgi:hypothetical protein